MRKSLSVAAVILCLSSGALAQSSFDPYRHINDPLSLAQFDSLDRPLRSVAFARGPWVPPGQYGVAASDTGAGMITHIWGSFGEKIYDTTDHFRIYINDTLLIETKRGPLFGESHGMLRPPFDTACSGAFNCDVQIPYNDGFQITFDGGYVWFAAEWRPRGALMPSYTQISAPPFKAEQEKAESIFYANVPPGIPSQPTITLSSNILARAVSQLADIKQSGVIRKLHLMPSNLDAEAMWNVWLNVTYNDDHYPSIRVPLAALFGAGESDYGLNSLYIKSSIEKGFDLMFPMPYRSVHIDLENKNAFPVAFESTIWTEARPFDSRTTGLFKLQYNNVRESLRDSLIPMLVSKGRGRCVGDIMNIPTKSIPSFLEGNSYLRCDYKEDLRHEIQYLGTEDYHGGGWYFDDGPFATPLYGCPNLWMTIYRLNLMNSCDYLSEIDYKFGHGRINDYFGAYRTVGLYYEMEPRLKLERDSVWAGQSLWAVVSQLSPNSSVELSVNGISRGPLQADESGTAKVLIAYAQLSTGNNIISVGNQSVNLQAIPLPTLRAMHWTARTEYLWDEDFSLVGSGFAPNTNYTINFGSAELGSTITDKNGELYAEFKTPHLPEGEKQIVAVLNGNVSGATHVTLSRMHHYEFEQLWPPVYHGESFIDTSYVTWVGEAKFSRERIVFFNGADDHSGISYKFDVPATSEYKIVIHGVKGLRYSNPDVFLDGEFIGHWDCFYDTSFAIILLNDKEFSGPYKLSRGIHEISFVSNGRDERSPEWAIGSDYMEIFPLVPDTLPEVAAKGITISIFPNPTTRGVFTLKGDESSEPLDVTIYDVLGKKVRTIVSGFNRLISIVDLPKGQYFVEITVGGGQKQLLPVTYD